MFAKRFQDQQRFTCQVLEAFNAEVQPLGCAAIVEASHLGADLMPTKLTVASLGCFYAKPEVYMQVRWLISPLPPPPDCMTHCKSGGDDPTSLASVLTQTGMLVTPHNLVFSSHIVIDPPTAFTLQLAASESTFSFGLIGYIRLITELFHLACGPAHLLKLIPHLDAGICRSPRADRPAWKFRAELPLFDARGGQ